MCNEKLSDLRKLSSNFVKSNVAYSTQACEHDVISM